MITIDAQIATMTSLEPLAQTPLLVDRDILRIFRVKFDNDEVDSVGQMHLGAVAKV